MINNIILACSEYFKFTFALSVEPRNEFEFYINRNLLFARISEVLIISTLSFYYFLLYLKKFSFLIKKILPRVNVKYNRCH